MNWAKDALEEDDENEDELECCICFAKGASILIDGSWFCLACTAPDDEE
jgi:hypothetical protein